MRACEKIVLRESSLGKSPQAGSVGVRPAGLGCDHTIIYDGVGR
jgi:hypothetical protein